MIDTTEGERHRYLPAEVLPHEAAPIGTELRRSTGRSALDLCPPPIRDGSGAAHAGSGRTR